jgi:hypothetical protein
VSAGRGGSRLSSTRRTLRAHSELLAEKLRAKGVEVLALARVRPQDDLYEATSRPCRDASPRARCVEPTLDRMVENPTV